MVSALPATPIVVVKVTARTLYSVTTSEELSYTCGRKKTSDNNSCDSSKETKSRCKCYKGNKGCSDNCKCLNCRNPHGIRVATPVKKRAKKDKLLKYQRETTKAHLQSTGSNLPEGHWNEDETLLMIVLMKLKGDEAAFDQCLPKIY